MADDIIRVYFRGQKGDQHRDYQVLKKLDRTAFGLKEAYWVREFPGEGNPVITLNVRWDGRVSIYDRNNTTVLTGRR